MTEKYYTFYAKSVAVLVEHKTKTDKTQTVTSLPPKDLYFFKRMIYNNK